ncbi:hypothetical protein [Paraburkholderia aromaticivorans]|nr:hypothetical protein [Paraburkholderia aromaticivorans]
MLSASRRNISEMKEPCSAITPNGRRLLLCIAKTTTARGEQL